MSVPTNSVLTNRDKSKQAENREELLPALLSPERIDANFERLWHSIEAEQALAKKMARPVHWVWPAMLAASLALTFASMFFAFSGDAFFAASNNHIAALSSQDNDRRGSYSTLADTATIPARCGQVRVLFADAVRITEMQSVLLAAQATIVDGPSPRGALTLSTESPEFTLSALRKEKGVLLAEPVSC